TGWKEPPRERRDRKAGTRVHPERERRRVGFALRFSGQDGGSLLLSQGRHARLHERGLRLPRLLGADHRRRRGGAGRERRFGPVTRQVPQEVFAALHAALGSAAQGERGLRRVDAEDALRPQLPGDRALDVRHRARRQDQGDLSQGEGGRPHRRSAESRRRMTAGADAEPCDVCRATDPMTPVVTISLCGVFDAEIRRCPRCGFRQIRPRLTPDDLRALYPEAYFDPRAEIGYAAYAREQHRAERAAWFLGPVVRRLGPKPRVLEVGSALGYLLDALRRFASCEVTGVDVSPFAARFAERT